MQNLDLELAKFQLFIIGFLMGLFVLSLGVSQLLTDYSPNSSLSFYPRNFTLDIQPGSEPVRLPEFTLIPQRIQIPSAGIDAVIQQGGIENGEWVLSAQSAYFLPKAVLGDKNLNAVIYAHKRPGLFINLSKAKLGDEILISDSGKTYIYRVVKTAVAKPDDLESLKAEGVNFITLITCDGIFDKERLVIKAALISS